MENKITKEELETIKGQQEKLQRLVSDIGVLETQKHGLLHDIAILNTEIGEQKSALEKTYGSIEVNLDDGSYEKIESKEEIEEPVS
jgi:hypothetical protein